MKSYPVNSLNEKHKQKHIDAILQKPEKQRQSCPHEPQLIDITVQSQPLE